MDAQDRDLIGRLFALLTAKAEDVATLAVNGQAAAASPEMLQRHASSIQTMAQEISGIAVVIRLML